MALAVTLVVVIASGLAVWLIVATMSGSARGHGPLIVPGGAKNSIGVPIKMGAPYSYGLLTVQNQGSKSVTLDRASLVRPGAGIELLGAYGLPIPSSQHIGFLPGYRMPQDGHAVSGLEIAPHAQVQIILGMKLTTPGRYRFEAVRLDYHRGGSSFHDSYPASGRLCSPVKRYKNRCPGLLIEEGAPSGAPSS
ncbi:MAG TPA: hypothetical protein VLU96_08530 [Gaiellaceae bacterium]|nr:hypothetical protein [Gaiellaceae bacterium]